MCRVEIDLHRVCLNIYTSVGMLVCMYVLYLYICTIGTYSCMYISERFVGKTVSVRFIAVIPIYWRLETRPKQTHTWSDHEMDVINLLFNSRVWGVRERASEREQPVIHGMWALVNQEFAVICEWLLVQVRNNQFTGCTLYSRLSPLILTAR